MRFPILYSPPWTQRCAIFVVYREDTDTEKVLDSVDRRSNFFRPGVLPQSERTSFALQLPTSQFPLLSQGEHPSTGTPCWYFHPCETETALRELLEADRETRVIEDEIVRLMELWFLLLGNVVDMHRDRQSRVAGTTGSGGG